MKKRNILIKDKVACIGDSLTKGRASFNWVKALQHELKEYPIEFQNYGVDGELAYNALQRLNTIVEKKPSFAIIQLGTNDIHCKSSEVNLQRYTKGAKLPQIPTKEWFINNVELIIDRLKMVEGIRIIILTIPILGENIESEINLKVQDYNNALKMFSSLEFVTVIDFNKELTQYLKTTDVTKGVAHNTNISIIIKSILKRYFLFQSWNAISKSNGLKLLTDTIHLNERSGKILTNLLKDHFNKNYSYQTT